MLERLAVLFWRIGMPSILVVEQEPHSVERINAALGAEGWRVRVVPDVEQAMHAASAEPPDLVMAGTDIPGFEVLTFSFSRRSGGPGVVALDPGNGAGPASAADARLAKPFTDQQVVLTARQALLARRQPATAPTAAAPVAPAPPAPAPPQPPPPVSEGTGVRKGRALGDFDFTELEELARPTRPASQGTGVRPVAPTPAPVPPPPAPPPPRAAAPPPPQVAPPPRMAPPEPEPLPFAAPPELPSPPPIPSGLSVAESPMATQRIPVFEEAGDQPGERFGQYTPLERLAAGGMAEVWKARMRGVEGIQKTVAITRILPHMNDNAEFVGMFIDEAKLAAQLTHPNIVHIYDLGKIGRDYYIAMEYVDGKDLRSLLNAARRKGMPVPLGLGLLIAARVASALDYAHRKRDFEDRELGLVHRDVSPQNVLLTSEGDVKLCDFGIAKAVSKVGQTQMGALKGKLQYMSPEQAWGRPVDARSDLFSLGAVLFEMVTGERLFTGESEISVLELVRQGRTRAPRQVDPAIPREVDEIVARALAVDPKDRFQSAGEMKQRLEAALSSLSPSTGQTDLALFIQRALEPEPATAEPFAASPAISSWP